jgi:hypothetical protein
MHRTGFGWRGDDISERWGKGSYARWQHINYGDDRRERLQALAKIERALRRNEVVHLSIRGFPQGQPQFEIPFFYDKFFLGGRPIELIELLGAPVIPCFAVSDERGRFVIRLYSAAPAKEEQRSCPGSDSSNARYLRNPSLPKSGKTSAKNATHGDVKPDRLHRTAEAQSPRSEKF